MVKNLKASILCVTYNQEKYIRQTLDKSGTENLLSSKA